MRASRIKVQLHSAPHVLRCTYWIHCASRLRHTYYVLRYTYSECIVPHAHNMRDVALVSCICMSWSHLWYVQLCILTHAHTHTNSHTRARARARTNTHTNSLTHSNRSYWGWDPRRVKHTHAHTHTHTHSNRSYIEGEAREELPYATIVWGLS